MKRRGKREEEGREGGREGWADGWMTRQTLKGRINRNCLLMEQRTDNVRDNSVSSITFGTGWTHKRCVLKGREGGKQ